ncbi:hypothetical protein RQP46_001379 [Phenoliferia psychrophenolica]
MGAPITPLKPPQASPLGTTDLRQWRLSSSDEGRHVWHYADATRYPELWGPDGDNVRGGEQSVETKYALGLPLDEVVGLEDPAGRPYEAAKKGFEFYKRLQASDGHWSGESAGPLFLLGGMIIALYITHTSIPDEWRIEISRHLANCQRDNGEADEGWGIDTAGKSTVFGTAMNYLSLRLMGVDAEEPMMVRARSTLHALGGCVGIPTWGKFWLCTLGLHNWAGFNATPPEMWLLPDWLPFHPHRWWIQTRNVYTPMSYLFRKRFQAPLDPLLVSLREELYTQPYSSINWASCRNNVAPSDLYAPHTTVANLSFGVLNLVDPWIPSILKKWALEKAYSLIVMEDENTGYQIRENPKGLYRHDSKGGWAFSTKEQGYTVSDCTSEALKAVMMLQSLPNMPQLVSEERMRDAVDIILSYQNAGGGFSSFEPIRGPQALELFNAAEVFGMTALARYSASSSTYRAADIRRATLAGLDFIRASQRPDGVWYGSWGVCFSYATMFALESLALAGESYANSAASCETHTWVSSERSLVVQTSWVVLALLNAQYPVHEKIREGCKLIMSRQLPDGSWAGEGIEGVGFTYPNFKFSWTIFALGKAAKLGTEGW